MDVSDNLHIQAFGQIAFGGWNGSNAYTDRVTIQANTGNVGIGTTLPKDTLTAYNKAVRMREKLLKGADFVKMAKDSSDDQIVFAQALKFVRAL